MDFEAVSQKQTSTGTDQASKYPLRRVEPSLRKFIKVLQIDLDRLKRHQINIENYEILEDYGNLHKEHVNATRTVQQLKANIRQLEHTRSQVIESDLEAFEKQVQEIQCQAVTGVTEFLNSQGMKGYDVKPTSAPTQSDEKPPEFENLDPLTQHQMVMAQVKDEATQESLDELVNNLEELNGLIHTFSQLVHVQGEAVNTIEDNMDKAAENVSAGKDFLAQAAKLKTVMFPIAGALIGGAIGGPVGLVAGIKIGGLAAVGGGLVGFTGGTLLKAQQDSATSVEMEPLNKNDSESLPDLSNSDGKSQEDQS